jgi:ribonuclease-3
MESKRIINPWNHKNHLLTEDDIYLIYEKAGFSDARSTITIHDLDLYQTAFLHSSYVRKSFDSSVEFTPKPAGILDLFEDHPDYENQEFLGDRCIELAVAYYIYRRFPDSDQGFKTVLKTKLVKKDTLAKFARFLDIPQHIIISKHVEEKTEMGRNNTRILEDVMEAFMCAVFMDNNKTPSKDGFIGMGWQIVHQFLEFLLETVVDFEELLITEDNFKEKLMQFYHKEFSTTPEYITVSCNGPPNARIFTEAVLDKFGKIIVTGVGSTRRQAQQNASREALKYFGVLSD